MTNLKTKAIIEKFRMAFGEKVSLPIAVSYTDSSLHEPEEKIHCMMNYLIKARDGITTSLSTSTIYCRGGKVYTGFGELNDGICKFVSCVEKYKDTPESVTKSVEGLQIHSASRPYLTFQRIDRIEDLDNAEGIMIFANADVLAGLWSWANFDVNEDDAVVANFGSGCSSTIANMRRENHIKGHRCFISMLDISVRPMMNPNEVVFSIPRCRLEKMMETIDSCCLSGAPAWIKIRDRINQ